MSRIYKRNNLIEGVVPKKDDEHARKRNIIINNRVTPEDRDIIYKRIELSGLTVQDYITECCKHSKVTAIGNVKTFDAIRREMKVIDEHLCQVQRADELDLQVLETRLSRLDSKPDEMQMDGVVEFEGIYYTIYGSPLAAVNNHIKSESKEYYILTLASLGEEFRARGIQPGPNKIHVRLGCGLPQKWYDRQKESFRAMLWKNRELRFAYCGNIYNVVIENVTVYMQGFAALPVLECITQKSEHVVLVDIGGETVDVIVCEGFHPLLDQCRIDTRATIALLKDIDSELQSELGETIPEQDIIKYICKGNKDMAPCNPYEEIMQRCLCKYTEYIFTRLKEWGVNTNYTTICFLGGGGRIIQSFGNYGSNIHFCEDMKINAKGYEFFETTLAMKQR